MAKANSTGQPPAFLLSTPIQPAVIRGRLYFAVGDVEFAEFRQAACAWSATECHRLDVAEPQPAPRCRSWSDGELLAGLEFFGAPKLAGSYTGLCAELRQEIQRRQAQGGCRMSAAHELAPGAVLLESLLGIAPLPPVPRTRVTPAEQRHVEQLRVRSPLVTNAS